MLERRGWSTCDRKNSWASIITPQQSSGTMRLAMCSLRAGERWKAMLAYLARVRWTIPARAVRSGLGIGNAAHTAPGGVDLVHAAGRCDPTTYRCHGGPGGRRTSKQA